MNKKKVLHLVDHLNENCGMSLSTIQMIVRLEEKGFEGCILSGAGNGFENALSRGIKLKEFSALTKKITPWNLYQLFFEIYNEVRAEEYDLIHSHHRFLGMVGWLISRITKIPIVHSDHNILYGKQKFSYWGDLVIADSEANKRHLKEYFKLPESKIRVCYAFTDLDNLFDNKITSNDNVSHFGQIGRLEPQKGQTILLEAFASFLEYNPDARLTIKGDGSLKNELIKFIHKLGIEDSVYFEEPDKDIKSFFERYNISVYSEHLSYTTDNKGQLYDLLPMPFTVEAINQVVQNIQQVQECLNFKIAIENVSYYCLPAQEMSELEFLLAIIQKADCYLLLDINNIYVNSINHGYDPYRFIDAIPTERILYMHVAGHYTESDELLIDTHGQDVCSQVWRLLEYAYNKHGIWPTLLERDSHIPPLTSLCDELNQIREIQQTVGAVNFE